MRYETFSEVYFKARDTLRMVLMHPDWSLPAASGLKPEVIRERRLRLAIRDLRSIMGPNGFMSAADRVLYQFRLALSECARGTTEGAVLLRLAGLQPGQVVKPETYQKDFLATLKLLRHSYRVQRAGGQTVWVVTLPSGFTFYPFDEFKVLCGNANLLKTRLDWTDDGFDAAWRGHLGQATLDARDWARAAQAALTRAQAAQAPERDIVRHWFAGDRATDGQVDRIIPRLSRGYGDILRTISGDQVIFGDDPFNRGEGNVSASVCKEDTLPIINIQEHMFTRTFKRCSSQVYWGMTVVHELSHAVLKTKDHCYDHQQLEVTPLFSSNKALNNADSWAYFAAEAANMLSAGHIAWALNGGRNAMANLQLTDADV